MNKQVTEILRNCAQTEYGGIAPRGKTRFRMTGEGIKRLSALGLVGKGDTFGKSGPTLEYFQGIGESLPQEGYRYEGIVYFNDSDCEVYLDGFCLRMFDGNAKQNTVLLAASIIGEYYPQECEMRSDWLRFLWEDVTK